jgi:hypothetical protein
VNFLHGGYWLQFDNPSGRIWWPDGDKNLLFHRRSFPPPRIVGAMPRRHNRWIKDFIRSRVKNANRPCRAMSRKMPGCWPTAPFCKHEPPICKARIDAPGALQHKIVRVMMKVDDNILKGYYTTNDNIIQMRRDRKTIPGPFFEKVAARDSAVGCTKVDHAALCQIA